MYYPNEAKLDLHAHLKVKSYDLNAAGEPELMLIETTCGRVMFNEKVPREVGYINDVLTKKALRDIIGEVLKICGTSRTAQFLDDIKGLGYEMAFRGGLSFNLDDIIIPKEKEKLVKIQADIIVHRETQKAIIIGDKGKMIRQIGMDSRRDIEEFLQQKVFLEIYHKLEYV